MVLTIGTSLNLPIIEHECNFSKKKSFHFYSLEHKCDNASCQMVKVRSSEKELSKVPCCNLETSFVNNTEPVLVNTELSVVQVAILTQLFNYVKAPLKFNFVEEPVLFEHEKLYGYQYRIALQSFLC